jgi:hypothetical protein
VKRLNFDEFHLYERWMVFGLAFGPQRGLRHQTTFARSNTLQAAVVCSDLATSIYRWLTPPLQGMNDHVAGGQICHVDRVVAGA